MSDLERIDVELHLLPEIREAFRNGMTGFDDDVRLAIEKVIGDRLGFVSGGGSIEVEVNEDQFDESLTV